MAQGPRAIAEAGEAPQHIYISPHADDVALSCGGRIYDQVRGGARTLVIGVFVHSPPPGGYSPFAGGQHARWELAADPMAQRRAEDAAALQVLGAAPLYLDYLDCIYRLHPRTDEAMYASEEGIFGQVDAAESAFHLELAERVAAIVGTARGGLTIYAPLTAGHHVDHQLVHRAALELLDDGYRVLFYEDYPYAAKPGMLEAALDAWRGPGRLQAQRYPLSAEAISARIAAVAEYASQIATLFDDLASMERDLRDYSASLSDGGGYAERYWLPGGLRDVGL